MWQLYLLSSLAISALALTVQKKIHNKPNSNPIVFAFCAQLVIGVLIFSYGIISNNIHFPSLLPLWKNLLIMPVLYGFGQMFIFRGLKHSEMSVFSIINGLSPVVTIACASLFLGGTLTYPNLAGIILLISSIIIINLPLKKTSFNQGFWYTLTGAMFMGLGVANDKLLIGHFSVYAYLLLGFALPGLLMAIINHRTLKEVTWLAQPDILSQFITYCLLFALNAILFFTALSKTPNPSQFGGINLSQTIFVQIAAFLVLKERTQLKQKAVAVSVSLLGLVLVTLV